MSYGVSRGDGGSPRGGRACAAGAPFLSGKKGGKESSGRLACPGFRYLGCRGDAAAKPPALMGDALLFLPA